MTILYERLTAWESRVERSLPEEHALALASSGVVRVEPLEPPKRWYLSTDSRVGVVVGDGWQIEIAPRLAIPRLLFLLAYSADQKGWQSTQALFEREESLLDAIAMGFAVHAERALRPGVLHGYITVDEQEQTLRGRIRFGDQLTRHPGSPLPLEVRYDEFTPNVLENRFLKTAAEVLVRLPRIPAPARRLLTWVRGALDAVDVLHDAYSSEPPAETRLNERYTSALALAALIIRASSISATHGRVVATSFTFDMNEVFESFLSTALEDAFRRYGGWLDWQSRTSLAPGIPMKPDLVWKDRRGVRAVIDAKYKSLVDKETMPNADAYQMLAYCIALDLQRGYLVYAKDASEDERLHRIVRHGYEIDVRSVDVELEPDDLLGQMQSLADSIAVRWRNFELVAA
jgi:5-methylcytosine-specific restriction enzyme subunit McrC